jgi:hypothetical protein
MTRQKPIRIECIKPITLDGEDDGLPDTLECNTGDVFGDSRSYVYLTDYGYEIGYGTVHYLIATQDFEKHFRLI